MGSLSIFSSFKAKDGLTPFFKKAEKSSNKFTNSLGLGFLKVNKGMKSFGRNMQRKVTLPLIGLGASTLLVGSKFEDSMASLEAITGMTGNALGNMQTEIMNTGEAFGIASVDISKGMELIGSKQPALLKTPKVLLAVTKSAMTLSKAAGTALPETAESLLSIMNAFKLSGDKADETINIMAASAKLGAVQVSFVSESLKRFAGTARNMNIDIAESTAAVQILGENMGRTAEVTGTAMRAALNEMNKKMGASSPKIIGLDASLLKLQESMKSGVDISKVFGTESTEAIFALVENRDALQKLRKDIQGTNVAYEQAEIRMKTFSEITSRIWVKFKNILIKSFFIIKPVLEDFAKNYISPLLDWFTKLSPSTKKWVIGIAALTAVIGPLAIALGSVIAVISAIGLPILGIIVAIGALVAAGIYLWKNWTKIMESIRKSNNIVFKALAIWIDSLGPSFALIGEYAEKAFSVIGTIIDAVITVVTGLYNILSSAIDLVISFFQTSEDGGAAFRTAWTNMGNAVMSIIGVLKGGILSFASLALNFLIAPIEKALSLASELPGFLGGNKASGALESIMAMKESLSRAAAEARKEALGEAITTVSGESSQSKINITLKSEDGSTAAVDAKSTSPNININNMALGAAQ